MRVWLGIGLTAALILAATPPDVLSEEARASEILKRIKALQIQPYDFERAADPSYRSDFAEAQRALKVQRAELIDRLVQVAPDDHPELPSLLTERWQTLATIPGSEPGLNAELERILTTRSGPPAIEAAYFRALIALGAWKTTPQTVIDAINDFIRRAPDDDRGAFLLFEASETLPGLSSEVREQLQARIIENYSQTEAGSIAKGLLRRAHAIGDPFVLRFNDAITGKPISILDDLRGQVVVVFFWATWCQPSVQDLPKLNSLHKRYRHEGVRLIGVNLDFDPEFGGPDFVRDFVASQGVTWPQYYQGEGWKSPFSRSWGINELPTIFLIDHEGRVRSTDARERLEPWIQQLLDERRSQRITDSQSILP